MSCGVDAALATAARRVEMYLDGEAGVLGGWVDAIVVPPLIDGRRAVRLVYAFPAMRVATLRHWRDEVELDDGDLHVLAMEASKWARLLLKGHVPTLDVVVSSPASGSSTQVAALHRLGMDLAGGGVAPPERFDLVDAWLADARRAVA